MAGNTEQLNLMQKQVSELRSGFDRLFYALQTGFTRLIQALQVLTSNIVKASVRPEAFLKSISGQTQGKGKAAGSSASLFDALDQFIEGLQMVRGLNDDPNAKTTADPNATKKDGAGYWDTMKKMGAMAKKPLGAMQKQFAALGPQAMLAAVALAPMQELLTNLLEPLEPITDIFGAFGSLLSQMFLPVMQIITPFLTALLPIMDAIGQALGPIVELIFQFSSIGIWIAILTPLIPLISTLASLFAQVMTAVAPLLTLFSTLVSLGIDLLLNLLTSLFGGLGISLTDITAGITNFAAAISDFVNKIFGWIENLKGQAPEDWAISKSKEEGGWW